MITYAIALTRAWTALYTRGLPANLRTQRREEIDCDLWEHQRLADLERAPTTSTAVEMLLRLVLGLPADLLWRLETGTSARSGKGTQVNESLFMRGLVAAGVIIALIVILGGGGAIFATWEDGDSDGWLVGGTLTVLAGTAIVVGLLISRRYALPGVGLVAVGSIAIAILWYWLLVITVPVGLALVGIAYARGRQSGGTHGGGEAKRGGRFGWLFLIIGVCTATLVGMGAYAFSLEEWGEARSVLFNAIGLPVLGIGLIALAMLMSDIAGAIRGKRAGA